MAWRRSVMGGRLSSDGENVRLRDGTGTLVDLVDYSSEFRGRVAANGGGGSIELINPALDNSLGSSWRSSYVPTPWRSRPSKPRCWRAARRAGEGTCHWKTDSGSNRNLTTARGNRATGVGYDFRTTGAHRAGGVEAGISQRLPHPVHVRPSPAISTASFCA
ncbi:MAG: hypothetical protein R3F11_27720 [Verrucomicrobiales bacterium]